jgi:hypothetical protein
VRSKLTILGIKPTVIRVNRSWKLYSKLLF